jgi:predicted HicB family RNase H-like nuclease
MLKYKNYTGHAQYDNEAKIFHGEVDNIGTGGDIITFQSKTEEGLEKEFRLSVDEYLNWCKERNEVPAKPFTGKFILRVSPVLHQRVYITAKHEGVSLNKLAVKAIDHYLHCKHV